ncbi:MAG: phosphopyruvate hydratase [bacterium]|nr:phosphopyruvate hydratase [bacterium]
MQKITDITAQEIQDSRGRPTVSVTVSAGNASGTFDVPSGASTGSLEAYELRDANGHVSGAVLNVNSLIRRELLGMDVCDQSQIDAKIIALDGTVNKSKLGGNATIGVSIAAAKAAAKTENMEPFEYLRQLADIKPSRKIPYLYLNYINGGKHAKSPIAFQEHTLVPDTGSVTEALEMAKVLEKSLYEIVAKKYGAEVAAEVGDEGGYVLPAGTYETPFELSAQAIHDAGYDGKCFIAADVASSSFYENGAYVMQEESYTADELREIYLSLIKKFPILSIEDPFFEESFEDFAKLQKETPVRIVGDDLTVTNKSLLARAIGMGSIRAIIIKPNQIGTLSETLDTMHEARSRDVDCIVSHRSGETNDDFIADLAFAFGCFGLKAGAPRKPERVVKYKRLEKISSLSE